MKIETFRADITHLEQTMRLFDQYRVFYEQPSDLNGSEQFIRERLEQGDSVILLATDGVSQESSPFGFTQLYPSFSSIAMKRIWILNDLFIAPAYRRQGVGTALLEAAKQFATERMGRCLELATASDNSAAQLLYQRNGYIRDTFHHYSLELNI